MSDIEKIESFPVDEFNSAEEIQRVVDTLEEQFWLEPLAILHPNSPQVTSELGKAGHFMAYSRDLGPTVNILCLAWRWHALLLKNKVLEKQSYIMDSPISQEIKRIRREGQAVNPRWGISWLVWLLDQKKYCVFHPAVSSQRQAGMAMFNIYRPIASRPEDMRNLPHSKTFTLKVVHVTNCQNPHYGLAYDILPIPKDIAIDLELGKEKYETFRKPVEDEKNLQTTGPDR